jgi:signal transduction histidine kinase
VTIERALRHAVVAAGLVGVVAGIYVLVVLGLGRIPTRDERTVLVLSFVAAVAAAGAWGLVAPRVRVAAERLAYGASGDPEGLLRSFDERLTRATPLEELLLQLAESLRAVLRLRAVEVWTGSDGRLERTAADPERDRARLELTAEEEDVVVRAPVSGPSWASVWLAPLVADRGAADLRIAPIAHSGTLLGLLVVERDPGRDGFAESDDRLLADLARRVGLVLNTARLDSALQASLEELRGTADELRASRARVVVAADEERRRIERDLHDGAQQRLVALAVKTRLARELVDNDVEAARAELVELGEDIERAIDELRRLAHGIYPPLLAQRGLRAALAAATDASPVSVAVDNGAERRYPAEVEAAVYFCCLEALQNAAKHAVGATRVLVSLDEEDGVLSFEVTDDGTGFDPRARTAGAGLANMADRLGAIGGRLRIESAPGAGTKIAGAIPLHPASSER